VIADAGAFDLGKVVPRQLDIRRTEVLFEPVELCRTGDRHDPRLLPEEPCDRDLRASRVLRERDPARVFLNRLIWHQPDAELEGGFIVCD
jgi:hypothetical protein